MQLPKRLSEQLEGKEGPTRQKAARLVVDLARVAKAESFVEVDHAHVSGVSVITGGYQWLTSMTKEGTTTPTSVVAPAFGIHKLGDTLVFDVVYRGADATLFSYSLSNRRYSS